MLFAVFCTLLAFILAIAVKGEDLMSTFGASYDVRTEPSSIVSNAVIGSNPCVLLTHSSASC